ncbi:hypothetical protein [Phyllobacterium zundukense]|uniref:Uncharacterized protein n=1 Tax=Phyllobacterium zundukense TaxID=1867719 RepID=A0A2N9W262_9HYPH|nr:hypothetical protein [Phyllobacterium zundukense]PIO45830.1 hypothetical protein B5P45_04630 [Phyllobacterium zundukense]
MSVSSKLKIALVTGVVSSFLLEVGMELPIPGFSFVTSAEARVGRPLTPVSVAGVARRSARRTVRRCVAGVYVC